jgi:endonuclease/exonuclease/phosphatase (EEP) superfamily protein YafD
MTTHQSALRRLNFSRQSLWFQTIVPGGSIALCLAVAIVFWLQPNPCAAMLVLPRWMWILPGLILAALGWTRQRKKAALVAIILWLLYIIFFAQEIRSLFRFPHHSASDPKNASALRVISLNCNGGNEKAAAEVSDYHPDLVFFEESPLRPIVKAMATRLLGPEAESLGGSDVSIIARGKLTPIPVEYPESAPFAHARIQFASGPIVDVFAVRLQPYNIRADLWSPDCWRNQCKIRQQQRSQFERLEREIAKIPSDIPVIVGGDFNLPAGDKLFDGLCSRLTDTFRQRGNGWGDTLDNDFPVLRIDQVWSDQHFHVASVEARRTQNSDHRMVVCDLSCLRR